jgi:hypothetical protein
LQEARIAVKKPYGEQELTHLAYAAVTQQKTVKATALWVTEHIKELEGQNTLFELSTQDAARSARSQVATGIEKVIRAGQQHLSTVARFHESGVMDKIASESTVNAVTSTLALVQDTAPKIIQGLKGSRGSRKVSREVQQVARRA